MTSRPGWTGQWKGRWGCSMVAAFSRSGGYALPGPCIAQKLHPGGRVGEEKEARGMSWGTRIVKWLSMHSLAFDSSGFEFCLALPISGFVTLSQSLSLSDQPPQL